MTKAVLGTLLALLPLLSTASAGGAGFVPPRIAIVWPLYFGGRGGGLTQSTAVNVSVWPTGQMTCSPPDLAPAGQLVLGMAHNNDPAIPLAIAPEWVVRFANGEAFPSEEFDDVPANLAADPTGKYTFVVAGGVLAGGSLPTGNVWVHAADPRTYYPQQLQPTGFTTQANPAVDLRIQIVFPHDAAGRQQPVSQAPLVNVAVDIFQHGTTLSVRPGFLRTIPSRYPVALGLQIARGHDPLAAYTSASGAAVAPQETTYTINGQQYPRWVFNDVPVQPGQQYHFMAMLTGIQGGVVDGRQFPTIWTHAADARTYLPTPQPPPACSG